MPEPLIHVSVPLFALTMLGVSFRKALLISLLALAPDLDVFFGVHPSATHSLIVLLAPCALAVLLAWRVAPRRLGIAGLSSLALLSHPTLDVFTGFRPLLWPLVNRSFYLEVGLGSSLLQLHSSPVLFPKFPPITEISLSGLTTPAGLAVSSVLLACVAAKWAYSKRF